MSVGVPAILAAGMPPLSRARRHAGLTQEELAAKANCSPATVAAIEQGRRRYPHPRTMRRIAAALALPIDRIEEFANGHSGHDRPPQADG